MRTLRRGKTPYYIVSALGLFDVSVPDVFLSDQALWPAVMQELPDGAVFDTGLPKPQGEWLVAGFAKAPSGTSVRAMLIEVMLGEIGKRVAVFGDRYWTPAASGFVFTEPQPFAEMKIDLARMFGGTNHPQNTVGVGYHATQLLDARQLAPLPNFEDPRRLIRTIDETPLTVGLGPIDLLGRDRMKYAGTFDKAWQETFAPHPPLDMDPRYYCMAPEDQRIAGFFRGDEALRVNGMTADATSYGGRLPGLRARAFVMRTSEPAGFLELDMKLDTVLLLGSHRKGVVVFRGMVPVADVDAKDLAGAMIAYERLRDPPRSIEHYAEVYRLRSDKTQAAKYAFAEWQLTPDISDEEKSRRRKAREAHTRAVEQRFADGSHLLMRRQMALAGMPESLVPAKPDPVPLPVLLPTPEEIESGDIDLAEILDGIDKHAAETRAKLAAIRESVGAAQGADGSFDIGKLLGDLEANAGLETSALQKSLGEANPQLPAAAGLLPAIEDSNAETKSRATQAQTVLDSLLGDGKLPSVANQDAGGSYDDACARFLETPDAGIIGRMRAGLTEARKTVDSLAGQETPPMEPAGTSVDEILTSLNAQIVPNSDVAARAADTDQKLSQAFPGLASGRGSSVETLLNDLTGAASGTVSGASVKTMADVAPVLDTVDRQVEEAAVRLKEGLAKARRLSIEPLFPDPPLDAATAIRFGAFIYEQWRRGIDLRGRDLAGADLSGMDFSGADFTGAFLERANLSRAIFRGAICENTAFAGAKLDAACFDDAILKGANLARVSAKAASFQRVNLENINAVEANFAGADFEAARFAETQMIKVDFTGARWAGVMARRLTIMQCRFERLDASGAAFERCQLLDCDAPAASFRGAAMQRCAVVMFRAPGSDFSHSTLDGTGFASGAELPGVCFDGASLRGVTLMGANLQRASFVRARLDGAVVSESQLTDANFTAASLRRAQFATTDFSRSYFFAANFFEAQLRRANFSGAALRSANLYSANLADADLTGADITAANWAKSQLALETSHAQ